MDKIYYDAQAVGKRIKEIRKKHGYTQAKLAEALMVSVNTVSNIENGVTVCMPEYIMLMCQIFNISADYFYFGREKMLFDDRGSEIVDILRKCSDNDKEKIKNIIKIMVE